jgi:hypothetical protein
MVRKGNEVSWYVVKTNLHRLGEWTVDKPRVSEGLSSDKTRAKKPQVGVRCLKAASEAYCLLVEA